MITIGKDVLTDMLAKTGRAVNNTSALPVLTGVRITANGDLTMHATDLSKFIQVKHIVISDQDFDVVIPHRDLLNVVKRIADEVVHLEPGEKDSLTIRGARSKATLKGYAASEFVPFDASEPAGLTVRLPLGEFVKAIQTVAFAAATDEARPTLTTIHITTRNGQLIFEATDGYRLAVYTLCDFTDDVNKCLPASSLAALPHLLAGYEAEDDLVMEFYGSDNDKCRIYVDDRIVVALNGVTDARYPDVTKIIPQTYVSTFAVDRKEFLGGIRFCEVFAKERANIVALTFADGMTDIQAESAEKGMSQTAVSTQYVDGKHDPAPIHIDMRFLAEALSVVNYPMLEVGYTSAARPLALWSRGDCKWLYVVMPMHSAR